MQIIDAINRIDALKPNVYTTEDKISWLNMLDGMIMRDVISRHEGDEAYDFNGYTSDTPMDTELLVGSPYDEMYIAWLESRIDYTNAEYIRYNNSITRFNDTFSLFANDYNRNHMPKQTKYRYW